MATLKTSTSNTEKTYYPLFLDIEGKLCVVIGGGAVAERKVLTLLRCRAVVKIISPKLTKKLRTLAENNTIHIDERPYTPGDLAGASLVIAATDDFATNTAIRDESLHNNIPVNIVDKPDMCDFIVPSVIRKGPLTVAISTSGTAPVLAKKLRIDLERCIDKDYIKYARILGSFRRYLGETVKDRRKRSLIMEDIKNMDKEELLTIGIKGLKIKFIPGKNE